MKTRPIFSHLITAALALTATATLTAFVARAEAKATEPPADQAGAPGPRRVLDKGMSGDDIIKLVGRPITVTNLKTGDTKAEKWTYRRLVERTVTQEPTTVATETAFVGAANMPNHMMGTRPVMQYSLKHVAIYQVTALLMVNDHLVLGKQWNEQQVSYE